MTMRSDAKEPDDPSAPSQQEDRAGKGGVREQGAQVGGGQVCGGQKDSRGTGPGTRRDVGKPSAAASVTEAPAETKQAGTKDAGGTVEVLSDAKADAGAPKERPPADWDHFAPPPPRVPGALARVAVRIGRPFRFARHEWTLTVLAGLALSLLVNRGALADLAHTLPQDTWDPSLVAYLIAWDGFALSHFPGDLWQINAFFPSAYGLAYSDAMLGYAPFALIGTGPEAAVLRYNIIYIFAQALTFIGAYALVRQLGAARVAASVAAVAFALAPWRLGQAGHLQVLSTGGIVLSLAMLARGHGVRWRTGAAPRSWWRRSRSRDPLSVTLADAHSSRSPDRLSLATAGLADAHSSRSHTRTGWAVAGWLCATWQVTIGFGIGLIFAYVLLGACVVGLVWWAVRSRRLPSLGLLAADVVGGIVFAGTALLLAQPYLKVLAAYPNIARTDEWIALYSPPLRGFVTAPNTSLVWGDLHAPSRALLSLPGEMALLPGFALYALAAAGLLFSTWRVWVRLALLAGVVVTVLLGLGTHGPAGGRAGYLLLLHHLPGLDGLRTPGRLIIWTTLFLALLAAGGVGALVARSREVALRRGLPRPTTMARLALLLPLVLVLVEGIGTTPHLAVPAAPAAVATAKPPFLVLPSSEVLDMHVMLWSTDRFADVLNGGSGLVPAEIAETREQVQQFPDAQSVSYLVKVGVNTVVVLPDLAQGTPLASAATTPIDDLGITREVTDDAVIFHLAP